MLIKKAYEARGYDFDVGKMTTKNWLVYLDLAGLLSLCGLAPDGRLE